MTVLFLTTIMPGDRKSGGEVASSGFVEAMRTAGHRVIVLGYRRTGSALEPGPDDLCIADRHIESRGAGLRPVLWLGAALAEGIPYSVAKYRSRSYRDALSAALRRFRPDVVVLDHAQTAWLIPDSGLDAPIAYIAHNVEHNLYFGAAERGRWPLNLINRREARRLAQVESDVIRRAASVWAFSEADAEALARLGNGRSPRVFELPPSPSTDARTEKRHDIGILGTWSWDANAAGLVWFLERVQPRLPETISIAIAGTGGEKIAARRPNVSYLGRVASAAGFLGSSRVIAVPSVAGAGVQVKALDAIATGEPVVATPLAMRGIDRPPPTIRVAGDEAEFAATAVELLGNPPSDRERADAKAWADRRRDLFQAAVTEALEQVEALA